MMRDTGSRASQRADGKAFFDKRRGQRKADRAATKEAVAKEKEKDAAAKEAREKEASRFMSEVPESLIFMFRVLGLIR